MTCPKCQKQVNDRTVFCPHCGVRVQSAIRKPPVQQRAPEKTSKPLSKSPISLPAILQFNANIKRILGYVTGGCSLLSIILWLTIGFNIEIGLAEQNFTLYTYFFKQSHTTFLSVFVVLGLIAHAVCTLVPMFWHIPFLRNTTARKIALQSVAVSNILGMFSLNAALATSEHELLSYMNFSGWTCFVFMLAALVITTLLLLQERKQR